MHNNYWFVLFAEDRFGPRNVGISALSAKEARMIAKEELRRMGWQHISEADVDNAEIIEQIDISDLDQDHVVPNIGVRGRPGMWFPKRNS